MTNASLSDEGLIELDNQLCFMLYSASRAMTRAYQPMLKDLGLTYPQYLVLMVLWEWERVGVVEATVNALGERLFLDSGTLTPLLKRMEQAELIVRQRSASDERKVLLSLTKKGKRLKPRALERVKRGAASVPYGVNELEEMRERLRVLLTLLRDADRQ